MTGWTIVTVVAVLAAVGLISSQRSKGRAALIASVLLLLVVGALTAFGQLRATVQPKPDMKAPFATVGPAQSGQSATDWP